MSVQDITDEIDTIKHQSLQQVNQLEHLTEDERALHIIHLFVLDLLGRKTQVAQIFNAKIKKE